MESLLHPTSIYKPVSATKIEDPEELEKSQRIGTDFTLEKKIGSHG